MKGRTITYGTLSGVCAALVATNAIAEPRHYPLLTHLFGSYNAGVIGGGTFVGASMLAGFFGYMTALSIKQGAECRRSTTHHHHHTKPHGHKTHGG
jgi:hypothetical protein